MQAQIDLVPSFIYQFINALNFHIFSDNPLLNWKNISIGANLIQQTKVKKIHDWNSFWFVVDDEVIVVIATSNKLFNPFKMRFDNVS
jgi:hypothetical protein